MQRVIPAMFAGPLKGLPVFAIEPGEPSKSLENFAQACEFLARERMDRGGLVIAVGGGVVGDLSGFVAASYLRGVDYWQVPTTLLAMVDSAVGGKTAVNLVAGKNLVGSFHQPRAVFCDTELLTTLPQREFAAGMAEVIKYGLLADASLFDQLAESSVASPSDVRLPSIVRRCCEIKAEVVRDDEHETAESGGRALLNLGHTFAHAIEAVAGYGRYLHGEAVSIGLVACARLSQRLGCIDAVAVERITEVLLAHNLPVRLEADLAIPALMEAMHRDKKVRHGRLKFIVIETPGQAATRDGIEDELVREIWSELGAN